MAPWTLVVLTPFWKPENLGLEEVLVGMKMPLYLTCGGSEVSRLEKALLVDVRSHWANG